MKKATFFLIFVLISVAAFAGEWNMVVKYRINMGPWLSSGCICATQCDTIDIQVTMTGGAPPANQLVLSDSPTSHIYPWELTNFSVAIFRMPDTSATWTLWVNSCSPFVYPSCRAYPVAVTRSFCSAHFAPAGLSGEAIKGDVVSTDSLGTDHTPATGADFSVYPNPASSTLFISAADGVSGTADVKIFDAQGKLVHSATADFTSGPAGVDLVGLNKGVYLLTLERDRFFASRRFVIN